MSKQPALDLLYALSDELKLPLLQIARLAETNNQTAIETTATTALRLIDGYTLVTSLQGQQGQQGLDLSPVSLSATLYDVAQDSQAIARQYDTKLHIIVRGSFGHVMAHPQALVAMLRCLTYTLLTGGLKGRHQTITLFAKTGSEGITAGVLASHAHLTSEDLSQARQLFGKAWRPASSITQNSGAGLYIADQLCDAMATSLRTVKFGRQTGLAATFAPSQQLALL